MGRRKCAVEGLGLRVLNAAIWSDLVSAEFLFDPFARLVRKLLRNGFCQFIWMLVGRLAQKSDLLPITAAPFTKQEMNTQAESLAQRKCAVERF